MRPFARTTPSRVLFTSGSTGAPKGVPLTYRNFRAVAAYYADNLGWLRESQPVFLDWLPWHHGLGGVLNLGRSIQFGATHYIDDGRPLPGLIERTVRNLREVSPTIFTSVPSAWAVLATELERDPVLARKPLRQRAVFRLRRREPADGRVAAHPARGRANRRRAHRVLHGPRLHRDDGHGHLLRLARDRSRQHRHARARLRGQAPAARRRRRTLRNPHARRERVCAATSAIPTLTAAAFDEEGFFRLGDAVRLADPDDPAQGLLFAGRVVEDFKLTNGTWVRTGAVRLALLDRCAPLISDAVICGHDRDFLAALAWPNVAACQRLAPELAGARCGRAGRASGRRRRAARTPRCAEARAAPAAPSSALMLMAEPPSIDANEIADKGYVNQAVTRARRAHLIEQLYHAEPAAHIACAR